MSHYSNLIIVELDESSSLEDAVAEVMADGKDNWWDFYQIGGRWTGFFDGYKPEEDPANIEVCGWCGGTGDRATFMGEPKADQHPSGCNGCSGKGKAVKWPTQWKQYAGDVVPVASVTEEHMKKVYRVVMSDYGTFTSERYEPWNDADPFPKQPFPPLDWIKMKQPNAVAVIVDCHN